MGPVECFVASFFWELRPSSQYSFGFIELNVYESKMTTLFYVYFIILQLFTASLL